MRQIVIVDLSGKENVYITHLSHQHPVVTATRVVCLLSHSAHKKVYACPDGRPMVNFLVRFGHRLFFSRRENNVRRGLLSFLTKLLVLAAVAFFAEIALILMGAEDIFFPVPLFARALISRFFF